MRYIITLLLCASISSHSLGQTEKPLFSKLIAIKNSSEYELSKYLLTQELEVATKDEKEQAKARLDNFKKSRPCVDGYMKVKIATDQLVLQLKADITMSNKLKHLRRLQKGQEEMKWYAARVSEINDKYTNFIDCMAGNKEMSAAGLEEITGLFSAIIGIFTGGRDFRAEKIKSLCSQLDDLRLNDPSDLGKAPEKKDSE